MGNSPGRPFEPLPSRRCRRRKVPVCPQPPKPRGRGDVFQKDKTVSIQQDRLTDTDTTVNDRPLPISLTPPRLRRRPERPAGRAAEAKGSASARPGSAPAPPLPAASSSPERPSARVGVARCSSSFPQGPGAQKATMAVLQGLMSLSTG